MTFPFKKCYDTKELEGYGITVSCDSLGNLSFLYKNVEIGYLLDIPGEESVMRHYLGIEQDERDEIYMNLEL